MEHLRTAIEKEEWSTIFEEIIWRAPSKRLLLLWDIFFEEDLSDAELLKEKIYTYGSSLGAKDCLGRKLFVRMVEVIRTWEVV